MSTERFIATRMSSFEKKSFTAYILKFAVGAIALSVAIMIVATSVISGFKKEISDKMFDFWGHIVINDARASQEFEPLPIQHVDDVISDLISVRKVENFLKPTLENDEGYVLTSSISGVKDIYPFSVISSIFITKEDQFDGLLLKGVVENFNLEVIDNYLIKGELLDLDSGTKEKSVIISEQTAARMKLDVGDLFIVHFMKGESTIKKRFQVGGIYKSGLEEFDKRFAFVDHRWLTEIYEWDDNEYSHLEVHIEDLDDLDIIDDYIKIEKLPGYLYSESIKSRSSEIFQWLEYQNINEWLTLTLMTIVGIFNMITAFLIFTLERTQMIGLLKSVGARDWLIQKVFLISSSFVLIRGTIIGVLLGVFICLIQKYTGLIKLSEKDYYLSQVPIDIDPFVVLKIAIGSAIVTLIFLLLPSTIISRIKPVSALQFR